MDMVNSLGTSVIYKDSCFFVEIESADFGIQSLFFNQIRERRF
jgi:hypothetical protein